MDTKLKNYIREIAQIINDDALFHARDIPGNQDDFEDRLNVEPDEARHMVYACINELIEVYDSLDESACSNETSEAISQVKVAVDNLKMKI